MAVISNQLSVNEGKHMRGDTLDRSIARLDNAREHTKRGRCKSIVRRVCFETAETIPNNYFYIKANLTLALLPTTVVYFPWFLELSTLF